MRRPFTKSLIGKQGLFSKSRLFPSVTEQQLAHEVAATRHLQVDLMANFGSLGLVSRLIPADELMTLIYEQWNPCRPVGLSNYDPEDIRSTILFTDALIYEKGFSLSDRRSSSLQASA